MGIPLAILIVEDSESDAELIVRRLQKAGYDVSYERVETADQMRAALEQQVWNIVIADYRLPQFDAPAALKLLQATGLDIPFIVVSGTIGEETAVAMMRAGAHDYLMKNNLARLAPTVERELREAEMRRERKRAEEAQRDSEEKWRSLTEYSPDHVMLLDRETRILFINHTVPGLTREQVIGTSFYDYAPKEYEQPTRECFERVLQTGQPGDFESIYRYADGTLQYFESYVGPVRRNDEIVGLTVSSRDVTERKRAEEALHALSLRQEAILSAVPDIIMEVDNNKVYTWANQAGLEFFGEDVIGKEAAFYFEGEQATYDVVQPLFNGRENVIYLESWQRRKDGQKRLLAWWCRVLKDENGNVVGALSSGRDITERKQAEKALRESEVRYRTLVGTSPDGISLTDLNSKFIMVNRRLVELHGYAIVEEMLGTSAFDLIAPEDRLRAMENMPKTLETGTFRDVEYTLLRRDGARFPAEVTASVIVDAQGKPQALIGVTRDITERKRAEEALWKVGEHYRGLFEGVPVGLYRSTSAGQILDANPALIEMLGYPDWKSLVAVNIADLFVSPEDHKKQQVLLEREGILRHFETQLRRRDGTLIWVRDSARVILNAEGRVAYYEGSLEDITERKLAEEALRAKVATLQMLAAIGQTITSTLDLDRLLIALLERVRQAIGAEACSVALVEANTGDLVFRQVAGEVSQTVVGVRLQPGQGIAGWVASHGQPVLAPDVASDPRFYAQVDRHTGFTTRDLVCVPLMVHDVVTGVIELINKREGRFGQDDVQLVTSVAAQAAIAIENARLFENERAGRQRLETLYRIGQTVNSTLDADAILDRLTEEAMRATHATHGSALVARPEADCFERRSLRGYSPEQAERARNLPLSLRQGANGRAYWTQQVVYLGDAWADPDYFPLIPETRSELAVPILRGGQVIGNLDLQSPDVDAFRDVDVDFMLALTNQVAIALENARLFQETRRRLDELSVVSNVALVGAAGRPFDEAVSRAANALASLWPDSKTSFLFVDETEQMLRVHPSNKHMPAEVVASLRIPLGQGITGWAARERQPVRVGDMSRDPRHTVAVPGLVSEMVAPMVVGERTIGVVSVASSQLDAFSGDDLRLLTTLAGQLATIFEKARLDAELETERDSLARRVEERTAELRLANEQLRQAHEQVSRALEKEKELGELKSRFISMTSHEFRTPLTGILSSAEMLEEYGDQWGQERKLVYLRRIQTSVQHLTDLLNDVLVIGRAEAGKLAFHPAPLDLLKFCRELVEELQLTTGNQHTLTFASVGECVQAHMDENLLRHILTNLLSNAIKYSPQGGEVLFTVICLADQAIFRVQDQGIGIPPEDQPRLFDTFHRAGNVRNIPGTGLGLAIVKRSVDAQGGTIRVESQVGVGTTVTVTLPIPRTPFRGVGAANDERREIRQPLPGK